MSLNHATNDLLRYLIRIQTEDMPWNIARRGFLGKFLLILSRAGNATDTFVASIIGPENVYDRREDCGLLTYALIPPDGFLSHFNGQPLARICESRFPGLNNIKENLSSFTALSPALNAYHLLNTLVYLASNDLINKFVDDGRQRWKQFLDMLVYHTPPEVARIVFSANYLSIRAMWENAFDMAEHLDHSDAVVFLVEMILDAHSDWAEGMMNTMLFAAARFGDAGLLRRLIQKGARPSNAQASPGQYSIETAIVLAAERGASDCVQLMLDPGVCDPNASVSVSTSYPEYAPSRPVSNFHFFFSFIERQLSQAWRVDPEDGFYFWSDHIWTEKLGFCMEGLDLFLRTGADVDLPYSWYSGGWLEDSPLHAFHDRTNTPPEWYPTILDVSLYLDNRLFHCLEPYSRAHFATDRVTRSGLCKAALEGHHALSEYLQSRPPPPAQFMELILAEQFFMGLSKPDNRIVKVNARLGRSIIEYGVDIDSAAVRQCGGVVTLLEFLVASAGAFGLDEDTRFILEYLLWKGAYIGPEAILIGVQPEGVRIFEILVRYGADIERDGRYALVAAACADNYEAVDWLLQRRVDIKSEIDASRPLTLIGVATVGLPNSEPGVLDIFSTRLKRLDQMSLEMTQYLLDKGADMKLHLSDPSPYNFLVHNEEIRNALELMSRNPAEMAKVSDLDWLSLLNHLLIGEDDKSRVFEVLKSQHRIFDSGAFLAAAIRGKASYDLIEGLLETASDIELYLCAHKRPKLTPLQAAAYNCDQHLVLRLLDRGANINAPAHEDGGETVLTALLGKEFPLAEEMRQRNDLLQLLIAKGADSTLVGPQGWGPLHACARRGDLTNTLLFLDHGADPTAIGTFESANALSCPTFFTALDAAVNWCRLDITHVLLKVGGLSAHPGTTGYEGALMIAEKEDLFAIAQVIRNHVMGMTEELNSHPELLRQHEERMQQQISRRGEAGRRWDEAARRREDQNTALNSQDEDLTGDYSDAEVIEDGDDGEPEESDGDNMSESLEIETGDEWEQSYSAQPALDGHENDGSCQGEAVPDYGPAPSLCFTFETL